MSHRGGEENQGTGLRHVLDILVSVPPERLLSLTFQLGESPEDRILHALCLIVLQREAQALEKLQTLKENHLANHLAEIWQLSGGKLQEFNIRCGHLQESTGEFLAPLARIFKALSEQKLCDQQLRNLAYKRAVSSDDQQASSDRQFEYFQLLDEAKEICGPEFAEWMCSCMDLKSGSYSDPLKSQSGGGTTLKVSLSSDQSERRQNQPCPLTASCSMSSYPSHIEMSLPATASFQDDKKTQGTSEESEAGNSPGTSEELESVRPPLIGEKEKSAMFETPAERRKLDGLTYPAPNQTTKPNPEPKPAAVNILLPNMPTVNKNTRRASVDEEEEEMFYAFVILHAPEDAETAESLKERLEKVTGNEGAVFSNDFAVPGRSTLRSVEDAINNSAFTFLLLTRNFDTPMQEVEADSALINSINKTHKYNTVIPLLPRENRIPKEDIPLVLRTKNPLEEDKNFEKKVKKVITPAVIKKQRNIWTKEQKLKMEKKKREELKQSNQYQEQLLEEINGFPPEQGSGGNGAVRQPPTTIHIENANYIMIGNDSQMTVGLAGGAGNNNSNCREEGEEED